LLEAVLLETSTFVEKIRPSSHVVGSIKSEAQQIEELTALVASLRAELQTQKALNGK
jgi:hypothetical protein